jgi:hypothetical protein
MFEEDRLTMKAVVAALVVVSTLAVVTPPAIAAPSSELAPELGIEPDDVLMRIDVRPDGSAAWTIEYRVRLDDRNATEAFESLQRDIERNETAYAASFADRMRAAAAGSENATGREMRVRNVTVRATHQQFPQEYGVVSYRFTWEGFAARSEDRLRVGDALSGLYLTERTTLVIGWPAEYRYASATPTPDDRRESTVVWTGPTDFGPEEPRLVLSPAAGTSSSSPSETPTDGPGSADAPPATGTPTPSTATRSGDPWLIGVAALLVVGVVGAAGAVALRRRDDAVTESDSGETITDADDQERRAESNPEESRPPDELLSNEERVLRLVRDRGGRLKQQEVAEALDWTDAKTSQVVRSMRDEGQLDGFRLGRENVLTLPEDEETGDDDGSSDAT